MLDGKRLALLACAPHCNQFRRPSSKQNWELQSAIKTKATLDARLEFACTIAMSRRVPPITRSLNFSQTLALLEGSWPHPQRNLRECSLPLASDALSFTSAHKIALSTAPLHYSEALLVSKSIRPGATEVTPTLVESKKRAIDPP